MTKTAALVASRVELSTLFGALQGGYDQFLGTSDVIEHGLSQLFRVSLLDCVRVAKAQPQFAGEHITRDMGLTS
jgi:hypothetical protein